MLLCDKKINAEGAEEQSGRGKESALGMMRSRYLLLKCCKGVLKVFKN